MTYRDPRDEQIERLRAELAEARATIDSLRSARDPLRDAVAGEGPRITKQAPAWFETDCDGCACTFRYAFKDISGAGMLRRIVCPGCGYANHHTGVRHA